MFDPYRKWLGIPEADRPPTHYQLLAISPEERDPEVINAASLRQSAYVRGFQTGKYADHATQVLNELAAATVCLLNSARRAEYDGALDRKRRGTTSRPGQSVAQSPTVTHAPAEAPGDDALTIVPEALTNVATNPPHGFGSSPLGYSSGLPANYQGIPAGYPNAMYGFPPMAEADDPAWHENFPRWMITLVGGAMGLLIVGFVALKLRSSASQPGGQEQVAASQPLSTQSRQAASVPSQPPTTPQSTDSGLPASASNATGTPTQAADSVAPSSQIPVVPENTGWLRWKLEPGQILKFSEQHDTESAASKSFSPPHKMVTVTDLEWQVISVDESIARLNRVVRRVRINSTSGANRTSELDTDFDPDQIEPLQQKTYDLLRRRMQEKWTFSMTLSGEVTDVAVSVPPIDTPKEKPANTKKKGQSSDPPPQPEPTREDRIRAIETLSGHFPDKPLAIDSSRQVGNATLSYKGLQPNGWHRFEIALISPDATPEKYSVSSGHLLFDQDAGVLREYVFESKHISTTNETLGVFTLVSHTTIRLATIEQADPAEFEPVQGPADEGSSAPQ